MELNGCGNGDDEFEMEKQHLHIEHNTVKMFSSRIYPGFGDS